LAGGGSTPFARDWRRQGVVGSARVVRHGAERNLVGGLITGRPSRRRFLPDHRSSQEILPGMLLAYVLFSRRSGNRLTSDRRGWDDARQTSAPAASPRRRARARSAALPDRREGRASRPLTRSAAIATPVGLR
jgi:hypothetical protein